jgi:hypothetical protein
VGFARPRRDITDAWSVTVLSRYGEASDREMGIALALRAERAVNIAYLSANVEQNK